MSEQKQVFARKASGVVRSVSPFDAFLYGVTLAIPFAANFFLFPLYTYYLPGASWALAIIIGFVMAIACYVVYAGLASMMPRSGGDYVFQSRGVHPILSMISSFAWQEFLLQPVYAAVLLYSSATLGLGPLFTTLGVVENNASLLSFGNSFSTPDGLFTFTVIMVVLAIINNLVGIKWLARTQKFILFPATIISGITIPLLLFSTSSSTITANFNYYASALNGTSNAFNTILTKTASAGFVVPPFSWINTILVAFIIGVSFLMWSVWVAPIFGEIKGAGNTRTMFLTFLLGGAYVAFFLMMPELVGFQTAYGTTFTNAIAFQAYTGTPSLAFFPSLGLLTLFATKNVIVLILASVGYSVFGYFFVLCATSNLSRYYLAASIDGTVPAFLSSTSRRFKTPVNALLTVLVVVVVFCAGVDLIPSALSWWTILAVWTSATLFFGTGLAALMIPWTQKAMYKSSPISKYRGLLPIAGLITFLLNAFVLVGYVFIPALSIGLGYQGGVVIAIEAVAAVIWYYGFKRYQATKGIDVGMAYRELPPE